MHINNNQNVSIFDLLIKNNSKRKSTSTNLKKVSNRDSLKISSDAQNMIKTNAEYDKSLNTIVDESIDLQTYVDKAREANKAAIANAGNKIRANNFADYEHTHAAFYKALTEKYVKLLNEVKSHSDPEDYIRGKYLDENCSWYAGDLTEQERHIGYRYEMQMLRMGKIKSVKYKDSLFRGIEVNGSAVDTARNSFDRQMINAQIGNILKGKGINLSEGQECTFEVDPYSYYIFVSCADDELKENMETALNTLENGKNLYKHIKLCANEDGSNSTQLTEDGNLKYQAFNQVFEFTGLDINTCEEKDGTYYTEAGRDIIEIVNTAVDASEDVPASHKQQTKDWISELIKELATKGRDNVKDMKLSIDYSKNGLIDKYQDISYVADSEYLNDMLADKRYITL